MFVPVRAYISNVDLWSQNPWQRYEQKDEAEATQLRCETFEFMLDVTRQSTLPAARVLKSKSVKSSACPCHGFLSLATWDWWKWTAGLLCMWTVRNLVTAESAFHSSLKRPCWNKSWVGTGLERNPGWKLETDGSGAAVKSTAGNFFSSKIKSQYLHS